MLRTGLEPARAINAGDFKSPVSTIPPSELPLFLSTKSLLVEALLAS